MNDAVLIQQATGPHAYLLNLTVSDHAAYCLKHGIDYQPTYGDVVKDRHAFWNKLALIRQAVAAGYERVIWLDSDCYIADDSVDLRDACPVDGIGCTWHAGDWEASYPGRTDLYDHHNAGAIYIGVGQSAERFLKCWWNSSDEGHDWHDQHALNTTATAAYRALWRAEPPIRTIGHEWNATPFYPHDKPIVAAWHGCWPEIEKRMEAMQAFIGGNRLRRMIDGCSVEEAQQKAEYCANVGNFAGAIDFFVRARSLGAAGPQFHAEYARCLYKLKRWAECAEMYREVLKDDPHSGVIWQALSSCYDFLGEHQLNGEAIREGKKHSPGWPPLMHNEMLWNLREGNWREGFDGMKWQYLVRERIARCPGPEWDGGQFVKLFVWAEQGLGDTIMLSRYIDCLIHEGFTDEKVIFEVQKPLVELFKAQCWPNVEIVPQEPEAGVPWKYDAHVGMFTLPNLIHATVENTPGDAPYLKAPAEHIEKWSRLIISPRMNIGFSWAGSGGHGNNQNRNMQASLFDDLVKTPGTSWYSLQHGYEIPDVAKETTPEVTWIGDEFADMADTAGALANLDLVITIDSAIAHLCGAMGVKVWCLISKSSDWRWLLDREDSVWYQSVRLFRQRELGAWGEVISRVENELKELLAHGN